MFLTSSEVNCFKISLFSGDNFNIACPGLEFLFSLSERIEYRETRSVNKSSALLILTFPFYHPLVYSFFPMMSRFNSTFIDSK